MEKHNHKQKNLQVLVLLEITLQIRWTASGVSHTCIKQRVNTKHECKLLTTLSAPTDRSQTNA